MKTKFKLNLVAGVLALLASTSSGAVPVNNLVLPGVQTCGTYIQTALSGGLNNLQCLQGTVTGNDATTSGTYIASIHDEFLSFSIEALETIQKKAPSLLPTATYGDWSKLVSGSGTLDVGVLIKAAGSGVLNNDPPFPDAESSLSKPTTYEATWGGTGGTDSKDPPVDLILTVQEVVDWLNPQKIPAFYFDLADPQNDPVANLYFSGRVYVTDAAGTGLLDEWAFDNLFNGAFDIGSMVLAPKNVPVYIPGSGCSSAYGTDWCMITNSRGSGSPEFIAYAPSMDLGQWANDGNLFWANYKITSAEAADEEIYLTRQVGTTTVPEPGMLALMGLGLLGLVFARRRQGV